MVKRSKEQHKAQDYQEYDPERDPSPQYHILSKATDRPGRRQFKAPHSRHASDASANKQGNLQARYSASPRLDQIVSNEHAIVYAQGQPTQSCYLTDKHIYNMRGSAIAAQDPTCPTNSTLCEQQFNLTSGNLHPHPQIFAQMPAKQDAQLETSASLLPWPSISGHTGTLAAGSSSSSSCPYLSVPSAAGLVCSNTQSMQLTPQDRSLLLPNVNGRVNKATTHTHQTSESSSSIGTPREYRGPSDGPIIIKSDA